MQYISPRRTRFTGSSHKRSDRRRQGTGPRLHQRMHTYRRHHAAAIVERLPRRMLHPEMPPQARKCPRRTEETAQQQPAEIATKHSVWTGEREGATSSEPPTRCSEPGRGHTQVTSAGGGGGERPRPRQDHRRSCGSTEKEERDATRKHMDVATGPGVRPRTSDGRIRVRVLGEKDTMHETRMRSGVTRIHVRSRHHPATLNTATHCGGHGRRRRRGRVWIGHNRSPRL